MILICKVLQLVKKTLIHLYYIAVFNILRLILFKKIPFIFLLKEPVKSEDEQQSAESSNDGIVYELDSSNSDSKK
jgi:hypothetical protein